MNLEKWGTVYEQAKLSLKKFQGDQVTEVANSTKSMALESICVADEILFTDNKRQQSNYDLGKEGRGGINTYQYTFSWSCILRCSRLCMFKYSLWNFMASELLSVLESRREEDNQAVCWWEKKQIRKTSREWWMFCTWNQKILQQLVSFSLLLTILQYSSIPGWKRDFHLYWCHQFRNSTSAFNQCYEEGKYLYWTLSMTWLKFLENSFHWIILHWDNIIVYPSSKKLTYLKYLE